MDPDRTTPPDASATTPPDASATTPPAITTVPGVLVLGAGSAGLATAAELTARGVPATVLDRAGPGSSWDSRLHSLRLNTSARISHLPGVPFPRAWGPFPTGRQLASYLRDYAAERRVQVETGPQVHRIDPSTHQPNGHDPSTHDPSTPEPRTHQPNVPRWTVRTDAGDYRARHVVVALGLYRTPQYPPWPDRDRFPGLLCHGADYRSADGFAGLDVLVVGAGASAFEIAHDLVAGGADRVRLAVRTPPNLMSRTIAGLPADLGLPLMFRLPTRTADRLAALMRRAPIGDLDAVGLPVPATGPFADLTRGKAAASVDGPILADLRAGRIEVVPGVRALDEAGAQLLDGTTLAVDAVVAATGYTPGLEPLVGHLGVLDAGTGLPVPGDGREARPGLRFVGYEFVPGLTGVGGRRGREVAAAIGAEAGEVGEAGERAHPAAA